jgi:hypothetical protein
MIRRANTAGAKPSSMFADPDEFNNNVDEFSEVVE